MTKDKPKTLLKQYFRKNKISVREAAISMNMSLTQLYRILNGECRPNNITTRRLFEFLKGGLSKEDIQPKLAPPRCPCCNRVMKEYLVEKLKRDRKEKRKVQKPLEKPGSLLDF